MNIEDLSVLPTEELIARFIKEFRETGEYGELYDELSSRDVILDISRSGFGKIDVTVSPEWIETFSDIVSFYDL